jgi:WS/DGAT/MGAT family acyltransferase
VAQHHLDRLSAVDAAFLHQEGDSTHMHIGGVARFAGPPPTYAELCAHVGSRLHLVPRYRQRIVEPPGGLGRQRWIDDPTFNLEYHLRHTALPAPGDEERLYTLVARIFSQRLDRTKPLWEMWMVEGFDDGAFALVSKTHHALVDGVSGIDLTTTLFDLEREPPAPAPETDGWTPRPEPSGAQLAATSLTDATRRAVSVPLRLLGAAARPAAALDTARHAAAGVGEVIAAGLSAAPPSPLNHAIGPHRRVAHVAVELADLKLVKNALGGTVNDVVLAVVAGALREWLHGRGESTEGLELKACVPVSTRATAERGALGNRITQVVAPLPVSVADPVERLRQVREAMDGIKESKQALGAEVIAGAQDFAPPTILAQASRLNFSGRFYNLLVTNIPGPQFPLYILGRELKSMFPVAFLAGERALAIAIMSYNGSLDFGLIADYDALPDLEVFEVGIEASLAEYVAAASR